MKKNLTRVLELETTVVLENAHLLIHKDEHSIYHIQTKNGVWIGSLYKEYKEHNDGIHLITLKGEVQFFFYKTQRLLMDPDGQNTFQKVLISNHIEKKKAPSQEVIILNSIIVATKTNGGEMGFLVASAAWVTDPEDIHAFDTLIWHWKNQTVTTSKKVPGCEDVIQVFHI